MTTGRPDTVHRRHGVARRGRGGAGTGPQHPDGVAPRETWASVARAPSARVVVTAAATVAAAAKHSAARTRAKDRRARARRVPSQANSRHLGRERLATVASEVEHSIAGIGHDGVMGGDQDEAACGTEDA